MDGLLTKRSLYHHEPPPYQSRDHINPTLLVSWWCTIFALTTILIRMFGRWIRTEKLFREDKIMFWSIVPLLIRMGLVHVVLIYGTNNTTSDGLSHSEILHRETGSRMVLAARIFYAAFIWIAKLTVLEFLKRTMGGASWAKSYEFALRAIYAFLVLTFVGIIIGTLAECRPTSHYWQVVPDPGPQCREGLVQLIVMGVCDIVTDVVLIAFPIPIVLRSSMQFRKKMGLIALFLLSIVLIAITAYRIPSTIHRKAAQPYRSLLASLEILAAAFVANIVIISSFIKDKGVKKAKFRQASVAPSDPAQRTLTRTRTMSVTQHHWGSDEDLVREMGMALPSSMRSGVGNEAPRAAPMAPPGESDVIEEESEEEDIKKPQEKHQKSSQKLDSKFGFGKTKKRRGSDSSVSSTSTDIKLRDLRGQLDEPPTKKTEEMEPISKQMSFFDVGGLVDNPNESTPPGNSREASIQDAATLHARGRPGSKAFLSDMGGFLSRHKEEDSETRNSSTRTPRGSKQLGTATSRSLTPLQDVQSKERRKFSRSPRPSRALDDVRGDGHSRNNSRNARLKDEEKRQSQQVQKTPAYDDGPDSLSFGDIGGLLK